ncbi:MAG TPA: alkaline phosphatase family protein, partial [Gaiellaceae bacterium]|nr:alkaline phosphatase family protein [Gaiellaceae bacterium]
VAKVDTPIRHLVIACQENRSFDHYFGYAPQVQGAGYGPPPGYGQPDGAGGSFAPYELTALTTPDIPHSWAAIHAQWNGGAMDGFYTTDGPNGLGYYTATALPFYYGLFEDSTLCANYFSSLLGPTWPNRLYFTAGTSGGITTNGVWGKGIFDHPMILDLLDDAGVTWGIYNANWEPIPSDNVFVWWKHYAHDHRTHGSRGSFLADARTGRLPQVSWVIPSYTHHSDEHPASDISIGMSLQQELIDAVRQSPLWESCAYLLTYDEHGGYFDHVAPPQLDAYGLGIRVPLWIVSPYAKVGPAESSLPAEHTSTLKLIEALHGLPTLASRNHRFDGGTPTGPNYEANGVPAPPRDGRADISDLLDLFAF